MIYQIANYVQASRYGNGGVFGIGSQQQIIESRSLWEALVIIAACWKSPKSENLVRLETLKKYPSLQAEDIENSIKIIKENNFLIKPDIFKLDDRYSRNKLYYNQLGGDPLEVQARIESKAVTIIGCGGIGNHVAYMLATCGIKKITLVDDDHIEISNLTRQVLFTENDINLPKTEVLKRELEYRNHSVEIDIVESNIKSIADLDKLEKTDLYIISADSPSQLIDWVNISCVKKKQPYINIGYINDISVIGPFYIPDRTSCFHCQQIVPDLISETITEEPLQKELKSLEHEFKTSTFSAVNGVSASYAVGDIIRYLGEFGDVLSMNKRIGIYSNSIKIQEQSIDINLKCRVCQL
ncbi:ThiF family adenylyltransferase [Marinomonas agarivorans]|nr:ThiF family adenylyltransferase [Marinomonas agarivorans]